MINKKYSAPMVLHRIRLIYRSALFLIALISYIIAKVLFTEHLFGNVIYGHILLSIIGLIYTVEIISRLFPSRHESLGSQRQFKRNYLPKAGKSLQELRRKGLKDAALVLAAWIPLNAVFAIFYLFGVIDWGVLVLIALAFGICDSVCVLYFCPFQTWFMKNRCCSSCRIYNWDFLMMASPLVAVIHPASLFMVGISLILFIIWEISFYAHPERFSNETNAHLSCADCKEKLCKHKSQLRSFQKKQGEEIASKKEEKTIALTSD